MIMRDLNRALINNHHSLNDNILELTWT